MDESEDEVRRRVAAANYPAASPSSSYSQQGQVPVAAGQDGVPVNVMGAPGSGRGPVVAIIVAVVVVLVAIGGAAFLLLGSSDPSPKTLASSTPSASPTPDSSPSSEASPSDEASPTSAVSPVAEPSASPQAQGDGPPFASTLSVSEMYDAYSAMVKDKSIFTIVPQTLEGVDYLQAFLFTVIDYQSAERFSPLSAEQEAELAALERRFLALEDLEVTIDITFSDGTNFTHDGLPPATP
jgi:hypothetical protein